MLRVLQVEEPATFSLYTEFNVAPAAQHRCTLISIKSVYFGIPIIRSISTIYDIRPDLLLHNH